MTFHHTHGFSTTCHGDDFVAEGSAAALDHLDRLLGEAFDVKVLPRIGPPGVWEEKPLKETPSGAPLLGRRQAECGCVEQWREQVLRDREGRCLWHPDTPTALPAWCTLASRHPVR